MESFPDPASDTFGPPPRYPLESVDNALRLLSLFRTRERIRVKDAAEALSVASGTAHRLLAMLVYRGYIQQDPVSKLYVPGVMLLSIGLHASKRSDLRAAAERHLKELHERLDETIQLATLEGREVFYVDGIESSRPLRVATRSGTLRPAHCASAGKALLATLPRDAVLELYPDEELITVNPNSIGSRTKLLLELDATRARGYAVNVGDGEEGVISVAAAVIGRGGHAVAAFGAGAPASRVNDVRVQEMGAAVMNAAALLGAELIG
jgi:DNA-binding IclR family transcriptional regulator